MIRTPFLLKRSFPSMFWGKPNNNPKHIYLTFDDGPIPLVTPWVLEQLKAHRAKGTFFCVGENVCKYPLIYQQILDEGHSVGNHTHNHLKGWQHSLHAYTNNIEQASKHIQSRLFRPPYGRMTWQQWLYLKRANYKVVMWDVLSGDFKTNLSPQKCLSNVIDLVRSGDVVVFHDNIKSQTNLHYALPRTLEELTKQGFEFWSIPMSTTA